MSNHAYIEGMTPTEYAQSVFDKSKFGLFPIEIPNLDPQEMHPYAAAETFMGSSAETYHLEEFADAWEARAESVETTKEGITTS